MMNQFKALRQVSKVSKEKIRHRFVWIATISMILFNVGAAWSSELTGPVLVSKAPTINGILSEAEWESAFEIKDFKVVDPETSATPSLKTRFKFLYDKKNLYIGIINEQPVATQVKRISARDKENTYVDRDMVRVIIDPTSQGLYGYTFDVFLGGSLTDGTLIPEKDFSFNWDAPFRVVTTQDDSHWYAEYAIPWDIMDFPPGKEEDRRIIGIYLQRDVAHLSERWAYPAILKNAPVFLHNFGKMDVKDINPQGKLTLFPYASVGYDGVLGERTQDIGIDTFWQATGNALVSATINPDFGDVENDTVEANFDSTETLLQEKRTFFVQSKDIFETKGLNLVNTRRIGDAPDEPVLPTGEKFDYKPQISDILGAVKVTGSANKFRYGAITAFEDDTEYYTNLRRPESEGRNFYAARALFENNSRKSDYIGLGYLGTLVEHDTYDAMVNSVDGQWLTMGQKLRLEGQVAVSDINVGSNPAAVEYSDFNKLNDSVGYAYNGTAIYYPTPSSSFTSQWNLMDSKFNLNDFGYSSRLDRLNFNNEYRNNLNHIQGMKWMNYRLYALGDYNNGNLLKTNIGFTTFAMLNNLQKAFIQAYYVPKAWDDAATYQQKAFRTKEGWFVWLSWFSDESKPFSVYINPRYYTELTGGITKHYKGRIKYSPFERWSIETEVTYWNKQHWIVGRRSDERVDAFNAEQVQVTLGSNFKVTAKQEIRLQIQWLGIDTEDKIRYVIGSDGRLQQAAIDWNQGTELKSDDNRSFDYGSFIGQVRYKYEFAPLCDLFIVYNRAGLVSRAVPFKTYEAEDLFMDSYDKRDVDKFLVKVRYRF
ncbi:MAG: hypothetical protein KKA41_15685 [Proteobacteria bacterium]|nr:hypothetical protein [Pseudomonadota bacterium]